MTYTVKLTEKEVELLRLLLSLDAGSLGLDARQISTAVRLRQKLKQESER